MWQQGINFVVCFVSLIFPSFSSVASRNGENTPHSLRFQRGHSLIRDHHVSSQARKRWTGVGIVGFKSEIIFHPDDYARSLRGAPVCFLATSQIHDDVDAPRPVQSSQGAAEFHGALTAGSMQIALNALRVSGATVAAGWPATLAL